MSAAITVEAVSKSYLGSTVLDDVSARVETGSLTVVAGPSGSGKTTLLNLISTLDVPDVGKITVSGADVTALSRGERVRFRASQGHVFQRSGLLGGLTVGENIEAGHSLTGRRVNPAWVRHLVERLLIVGLLDVKASLISGGQAQRTALVRALAHRPAHLFADEPTASLDTASKHAIHELLREVVDGEGTTVLMVSHDDVSQSYADDVIWLVDGRVEPRNE